MTRSSSAQDVVTGDEVLPLLQQIDHLPLGFDEAYSSPLRAGAQRRQLALGLDAIKRGDPVPGQLDVRRARTFEHCARTASQRPWCDSP
jgi:hypothetical protein